MCSPSKHDTTHFCFRIEDDAAGEPPARRREPGVPNRTLFITGIGPLAKDPACGGGRPGVRRRHTALRQGSGSPARTFLEVQVHVQEMEVQVQVQK